MVLCWKHHFYLMNFMFLCWFMLIYVGLTYSKRPPLKSPPNVPPLTRARKFSEWYKYFKVWPIRSDSLPNLDFEGLPCLLQPPPPKSIEILWNPCKSIEILAYYKLPLSPLLYLRIFMFLCCKPYFYLRNLMVLCWKHHFYLMNFMFLCWFMLIYVGLTYSKRPPLKSPPNVPPLTRARKFSEWYKYFKVWPIRSDSLPNLDFEGLPCLLQPPPPQSDTPLFYLMFLMFFVWILTFT